MYSTAVCDILPDIANGVISYSSPELSIGVVATYSCSDGYQLISNSGNGLRTCIDGGVGNGGVFDGEAPFCERKLVS